jgi:DNA-binding FrmR family transcriptional regulator
LLSNKISRASVYQQEHLLMGTTEPATHASDDLRKTLNRLKRAQGQLGAVITAVESGTDCRAVVTQLAAVSSAIDRAGFTIISSAMKECLVDSGANGESKQLSVNELEKLFLSLA